MLKELTTEEEKFYKVFKMYKSFARKDEAKRAGFSEQQQKQLSDSLVNKGYLSVNRLGHYKETATAQKARLGGLTAAQYVEQGRQRQQAENQRAFLEAFRPKSGLEKELD